ncbi:MAG: 50S ribosomal protein L13 [Candidatus Aenigmarchaeota archaeon]|nr:50S ribosomal protein L13 [Candidatus Aenigmarchaeota archaeon]
MTALIVDGKDAVLGRLASQVAKELLNGNAVNILNAQDVIITGDPDSIKEKYLARRRRGSPQHGPFFPKQPQLIVRRTIRGMLPYKTNKGREAFKKLRVYISIPPEFSEGQYISLGAKQIKTKYIRVGELAKTIGWHA